MGSGTMTSVVDSLAVGFPVQSQATDVVQTTNTSVMLRVREELRLDFVSENNYSATFCS